MPLDLLSDLREGESVKWVGAGVVLLGLVVGVGALAANYVLFGPERESDERSAETQPATVTGLTGTYTRHFDPMPRLYNAELDPSWCVDIGETGIDIRAGDFEVRAPIDEPRVESNSLGESCSVSFAAEIPKAALVDVEGVTYTWQQLQATNFHVEIEQTVDPCAAFISCE